MVRIELLLDASWHNAAGQGQYTRQLSLGYRFSEARNQHPVPFHWTRAIVECGDLKRRDSGLCRYPAGTLPSGLCWPGKAIDGVRESLYDCVVKEKAFLERELFDVGDAGQNALGLKRQS